MAHTLMGLCNPDRAWYVADFTASIEQDGSQQIEAHQQKELHSLSRVQAGSRARTSLLTPIRSVQSRQATQTNITVDKQLRPYEQSV